MYLSQFIPLSLALLSLNVLTASHPIPGPLTELAFPPAHEATLFPRRDDVDGSNNALLNNLVGIDISDTPRIDAHKAENKAQKAEDEAQKAEDEAQKADDELQKANKADQRENGQAASKNTDSPLPSLLKGL